MAEATAGVRAALADMRALVGEAGWVADPDAVAAHCLDWRRRWSGPALAVVKPASTAEVAGVVAACAAARIPIVPQAGNTSLVGGAVPRAGEPSVVLSVSRLRRIRRVDPLDSSMTVEAGCVLAEVQRAAAAVDRLFPLALGAEGTAEIGGLLSTNAGGVHVLRYGTVRQLALGLEVVLADGRVWDGLRALRKDNTGYDLKQLFVGAEGTLGVVTAAVLQLFPRPRDRRVAWVGVPAPHAALALLGHARDGLGDALVACELVSRFALELVLAHVPGVADPLAAPCPWYVLLEAVSPAADGRLAAELERLLAAAARAGLVQDGTVAASAGQSAALWRLRESVPEAELRQGPSLKHDVAVPVQRVPEMLEQGTPLLEAAWPGARVVAFGHLGDGNLHLNLSCRGADPAAFLAAETRCNAVVYDLVERLGGTISAEHGVGQLKRAELAARRSAVELDLMRAVKRALDPAGIMNPGKVL